MLSCRKYSQPSLVESLKISVEESLLELESSDLWPSNAYKSRTNMTFWYQALDKESHKWPMKRSLHFIARAYGLPTIVCGNCCTNIIVTNFAFLSKHFYRIAFEFVYKKVLKCSKQASREDLEQLPLLVNEHSGLKKAALYEGDFYVHLSPSWKPLDSVCWIVCGNEWLC